MVMILQKENMKKPPKCFNSAVFLRPEMKRFELSNMPFSSHHIALKTRCFSGFYLF